jgi:hypothetical protein
MRSGLTALNRLLAVLAILVLLPLQWACNSKTIVTPTTGTGSGSIPTSALMPEAAPVPVSSTPGSGLWIVGAAVGYSDTYSGTTINEGLAEVSLAVNDNPETTDAVWITTPTGPVSLPYEASVTYSSYKFSIYTGTITYTAGGNYGMSVTTSLGTATASLNSVPGNIIFSSNGASVTAANPGTYDAAAVVEESPSPGATYTSTSGTSVGSPFTFPSSAFPSASGTYGETYCSASWTTSLSGTASPVGVFVAAGDGVGTFTP